MFRRIVLLSSFCVALTSCDEDPKKNNDNDAPRTFSQEVGPAGGTIEAGNGTRLVIPPGALSTTVEISVTTFADTFALGQRYPNLVGALCGVELKPDGLEFAVPVTLTLSPVRELVAGTYPVFWHDTTNDVWQQTGTAETSSGSALETTITHFSVFSVFDLPYDVLDDFDEFSTEQMTDDPSTPPAILGELYVEGVVFEEESFCGQDQYYNGCCSMRAGAVATINYEYGGEPYTHTGTYGYTTDRSIDLSYSGNDYSIDLTIYLDCSHADADFFVQAFDSRLAPWDSTEISAHFTCSDEPIANREITFFLSGPGALSETTATTNAEGAATVTYSADEEEGTATITASIEGCGCPDWPTANQDETTVTISSDDGIESWSGVLTFHQWGDLVFFGDSPDSSTTVVSDTVCTVDLTATAHLTFDIHWNQGYWFVQNFASTGIFAATVTPGYREWTTDYTDVYYLYQTTYELHHLDQIGDVTFMDMGAFAGSWLLPDELFLEFNDPSTQDDECFLDYSLNSHEEGLYDGGPDDLPGFPRDSTDIHSNRASSIEITFDPPLTNGLEEGTIEGTQGRCLWYSNYNDNDPIAVSWSLTWERLD